MSTKHGPKGNKGKKIHGKPAPKGKRVAMAASASEAVVEEPAHEAPDLATPFDEPEPGTTEAAPPEDAGTTEDEAIPATAPATKRKRDMTIEDLRAEYARVIGRDTASTDRRYLLWKLSEAAKGKIRVGPIQKRALRDKAEMQVVPLGMERTVVAKLDAAWKALGFKSRSAFIRLALIDKLRAIGGPDADAAANVLERGTA